MESKDLYQLLEKGEHLHLECKRATNSVPNSIWETYSAFANTYGGTVVLGVHEHLEEKNPKKRFDVVGVDDAEKVRKDLWNMLNNPEKVSANILTDKDIETVDIDGRVLIVLSVPQADYANRPIFINNNPLKGSYRRNHEGDYHMSRQLINMMLRDANPLGNDGSIVEHYTMDDIDGPTLQRYRNHFATINPDHTWNSLNDKDFLIQLGGYAINRNNGTEGVTVAGLLMFGKGLSVRERFDNLRMDYIDYSNLIGDQRYSDRLTYDGRWENNLYNFMISVVPKLTNVLPRPFQMDGIVRNDDTIQHKAVREAFTNMIIHADMLMNGLIRVKKFDNRFEFTNPGLLLLPVEQIFRGGESKARNQRIQNMLRMIGYGENIGSGFPLIIKAWEDKHWSRPEIIDEPELEQTTLVLQYAANKDDSLSKINKANGRRLSIIEIIRENPTITSKEIAAKLTVSKKTIDRDLAKLIKDGVIELNKGNVSDKWTILDTDRQKNVAQNVAENVAVKMEERLHAITEAIKVKPSITAIELAKLLKVSRRTIVRDLAKLKRDGALPNYRDKI